MINGRPSLGCSQIPPLEMFKYVLLVDYESPRLSSAQ